LSYHCVNPPTCTIYAADPDYGLIIIAIVGLIVLAVLIYLKMKHDEKKKE